MHIAFLLKTSCKASTWKNVEMRTLNMKLEVGCGDMN
jgi:hypothetical protein